MGTGSFRHLLKCCLGFKCWGELLALDGKTAKCQLRCKLRLPPDRTSTLFKATIATGTATIHIHRKDNRDRTSYTYTYIHTYIHTLHTLITPEPSRCCYTDPIRSVHSRVHHGHVGTQGIPRTTSRTCGHIGHTLYRRASTSWLYPRMGSWMCGFAAGSSGWGEQANEFISGVAPTRTIGLA